MFIGFLFISYLSIAQGPLTGTLVINKGEIEKKWNDKIEYEFNLKNTGTKAIEILKVIGSCGCQTLNSSNIQRIQPGKSGKIRVTVDVNEDILKDDLVNGVIDYDKSVIVVTNGKKEKYQLYTRATIKIIN
jgi:hypothetical protein